MNSIIFEKDFLFCTDQKSPSVTVGSSGILTTDFISTQDKHALVLHDNNGQVKERHALEAVVRRMTIDTKGNVYLACVDEQCIKCFNTGTGEMKTIATFEGYPAGLTYDKSDDSIIVCDNQCPSYFVYEGGGFSRLTKIFVRDEKPRQTVLDDKCHAYISNVAINSHGDLCTADYINDTVFLHSTEGKLKSSFSWPNEDVVLHPLDIACDDEGNTFVLCTASKCVYVLDLMFELLTTLSLDFLPSSIEIHSGRLWIGSMEQNEVQIFKYQIIK